MTGNQAEIQAEINELLRSDDPKARALAQKLQGMLNERMKNN